MAEKTPIVCIIEDNAHDREVIRRYLSQDTDYDYHIYEEDTGEKGLELCRRVQPDCVVLDYNLPDINGLEFLRELAGEADVVNLTVIMLAGLEEESIALQAMKSGAQDYLVKDEMTPGNLFRAIHNAIERTSMRRTLDQQRKDLEQKNQEIQAFAYALAHDLRAPLRAISGFTQIVAKDYQDVFDDDGRHYVDNIVRACGQMDRLIEEMLNYTRIEHRAVQRKPVSFEYVLKQIAESIKARMVESGATMSWPENAPVLGGDPVLIKQIFVNLCENALSYVRPGVPARIVIDWKMTDRTATISVADNGIGLLPKHFEKIFTIFQRLHSDEVYPGTGIGLAIVKKATELMGGQVWVESTLGVGSTFYVRLPLY